MTKRNKREADFIQFLSFFTFFNEKKTVNVTNERFFIVHLSQVCKVWFAKMTDKIRHLGIVENINGCYLKVRIIQTSACSACSIKGHCSASDSKEKLIDVYNDKGLDCKIGQQVVVCGSTSMGMKAVLWAFGVPFLVLVLSLFVSMSLTNDEMKSALISLIMLIPYYIIIYFLREKFRRTFVFTLE